MNRPLLIIFLTILVNLIGFGIIIPLLPFYAQTFGASPLMVGLLFASFSLAQLFASPVLGAWSDKWGRRPVLIFSLVGTVVSFVMLAVAHSLAMLFAARIVDGLSGGNITTARAYIGDIATDENRAKSFGMLGAAFGLGFIIGPALGGLFARISYTAPIWAAAAITVVATVLAWWWLPETVHRVNAVSGSPWRALRDLSHRADLRLLFTIDFLYWGSFAVYQTTFALFGARRFGFDATHTGYLLAAFGFLGVLVQVGLVGPVVKRLGETQTLVIGLIFAAVGWGGSAMTHSLPLFIALLVPGALGIGLCNPSLVSLISAAASCSGWVKGPPTGPPRWCCSPRRP
jgi:DHA1 family tetracycline resistance protein-like MFS transporter